MEKFNSSRHGDWIKDLPFSYFSSVAYLDFCAYTFERNLEHLIVWQDLVAPHEFPSIFTPQNKANWSKCSIAMATREEVKAIRDEDIEIVLEIPMGAEFYYSTDSLLKPRGNNKNRIEHFTRSYNYTLLTTYDKQKIKEFYTFWKEQRIHSSITFKESEDFFLFCLDSLNRYEIKQVYVEIEGRLVGFAWGVRYGTQTWVGLHLKVDYQYQGLSRFLHQERAKLFSDLPEFTLGMGGHDSGIIKYKEELGPAYTKDYYYILCGDKQSK